MVLRASGPLRPRLGPGGQKAEGPAAVRLGDMPVLKFSLDVSRLHESTGGGSSSRVHICMRTVLSVAGQTRVLALYYHAQAGEVRLLAR